MVNFNKLMKFLSLVALGLPALSAYQKSGGVPSRFITEIKAWYFGIWPDGSIHLESLMKGWAPFFISLLLAAGVQLAPKFIKGLTKLLGV